MNNSQAFSGPALLTGATGYIGSALAKRLVSAGVDVHVIVRAGSNARLLADVMDSITVHIYDGRMETMFAIVAASRPQVVFHLASLFITSHKSDDIENLIHSNILFSTQLVEAMVNNGVPMLINTGTSWQHYNDAAYDPVNLYAATKQAFETILTYYLNISSLRATTLVLFDTYGPNDPRTKLLTLLWRVAESGETLCMSPGEQLIDIVHIDDVTAAFLHAAQLLPMQIESHRRYGVSSGRTVTLRELVSIFERVTGTTLQIKWGGREYRNREVMKSWSEYSHLPGWAPKIRLDEGIAGLRL